MTSHSTPISDAFIKSTDETYNHPSAGNGGFGQSTGTASSGFGSSNTTSSSDAFSSHANPNDGNFSQTSTRREGYEGPQEGGRAFGSGREAQSDAPRQGTAEVISTYGGKKGEDVTNSGTPSYGSSGATSGAAVGAGIGHNVGGADNKQFDRAYTDRNPNSGLDIVDDTPSSKSSGFNSSSAAYGAAGAAGVGAGVGGLSSGIGGSDNATTNTGFDSTATSFDNPSSTYGTGNQTIDQNADKAAAFASQKLDENTDKDGFTNLTGDKEAGGFTGRAKINTDDPKDTVVETTKERSQRDEQGRELDSYGKPYFPEGSK